MKRIPFDANAVAGELLLVGVHVETLALVVFGVKPRFSGLGRKSRRVFLVAASRQSAADLPVSGKECGALPRRRYFPRCGRDGKQTDFSGAGLESGC